VFRIDDEITDTATGDIIAQGTLVPVPPTVT
jgi:hypothetical protein